MSSFYNENAPYAAEWLRQLIAAQLIPAGTVDERSIADLDPEELRGYTQIHLFAGLGGWPYAARLAGWPDDRSLFTGSAPCQPFSVAGKRAGAYDPRHLWPHMLRILSALRPPVVMGEQVAGAAGYGWLDGVHADLEAQGYTCEAADIPACSVNAPHIRNRIYWLAYPTVITQREPQHQVSAQPWANSWADTGRASTRPERLDHPAGARRSPGASGSLAPFGHDPRQREPERRSGDGAGGLEHANGPQWGPHAEGRPDVDNRPDAGRPEAPSRSELAGEADREPGSSFWDEWILVGPDPAGKYRRTKPGVCLLSHGVPSRVSKLRALGNSIVPQEAAEVIRAYMETYG